METEEQKAFMEDFRKLMEKHNAKITIELESPNTDLRFVTAEALIEVNGKDSTTIFPIVCV